MNVTLINTSDAGGGAAAACMRLLKALQTKAINANLLVRDKKTDDARVTTIRGGKIAGFKTDLDFLLERIPFIAFHEKDQSVRFAFSTAGFGTDISTNDLVSAADLLHLHWTNSGYLSLNNLKQLLELNKPVVWTLHDMWAFTGGCHYAGNCDHFKQQCGNCLFLRDAGENDLSHQGWLRKNEMLAAANQLVFVTCSNWLAKIASQSGLLKNTRIEVVPNPIDTTVFAPRDRVAARQKRGIDNQTKIILFGAANINDRRKGIAYLVEGLQQLKDKYPNDRIEVMIFGKNISFDVAQIPFKVYQLGIILREDELAGIYSLADVFVLPSVEDNLPNMIMEALACGTPVVAFNTGGIPDMVEHLKNGYLAEYRSAADLAKGLNYILTSDDANDLATAARNKVLAEFSNEVVAQKYIDVYQSVLEA